ncbi:MAG: hypothetical protein HYY30_03130 [Chloroflexi bacterium]|nr:hypothetical protein [Chloroflexota bacterium]
MSGAEPGGYTNNILRVDLSSGQSSVFHASEEELRSFIGGTGLGALLLYREVPPGVEWSDPANRLILASGPLGGTNVPGCGSFSVVTRGCLTNGGTSTQANGYFGAYLKFCGYDAVVLQGAASEWCYLYINDKGVEIRDARHLLGMDTWVMEEAIKQEIGKGEREATVFGIGPAGENLVKFAAIMGDKGHAAAHNGVGAVMGSKRVKAVAVARGRRKPAVLDQELVSQLNEEIIATAKAKPLSGYDWGTSMLYSGAAVGGWLPVKNLTTSLWPDHEEFMGDHYRPLLEMKRHPCWACQAKHCHIVKVLHGPFAGYVGEEPEYEGWAAFTSLIGQRDHGAAIMLSDLCDRLGVDVNEAGWIVAFTMEAFEKGVITQQDSDGLELRWGNVLAAKELLLNIANRRGKLGNTLAEGLKRGAEAMGGEALNMAVYMEKGNTPRGHDHRARWNEMLDYATSGAGTIEAGPVLVRDRFDPEDVARAVATNKTLPFLDSLVTCAQSTGTFGGDAASNPNLVRLVRILGAVTGWEYTREEALDTVQRISSLLRTFNLRHGVGPEVEKPSIRYGSAPVDGPAAGKCVMEAWDQMLDRYYELVGWDRASGRPLPGTLTRLGLEWVIPDIWRG